LGQFFTLKVGYRLKCGSENLPSTILTQVIQVNNNINTGNSGKVEMVTYYQLLPSP